MYAYVVEYSQVHVIAASLYIHNSFMTSFKVSVKDLQRSTLHINLQGMDLRETIRPNQIVS